MPTLKEAISIAEHLTGSEADVSSYEAVRQWKRKGLISDAIRYVNEGKNGGRRGIFPDWTSIEIAITAHLKKKYSFSDISQARLATMKGFKPLLEENGKIIDEESIDYESKNTKIIDASLISASLISLIEVIKMAAEEDNLLEEAKKAQDPDERTKLLNEANKLAKKRKIQSEYIHKWIDFEVILEMEGRLKC